MLCYPSNPRGRTCRPSGKVSGEEGILSGVVTVYLYCPAFNVSVSLGVQACRQAAQPLSTACTVGPGRTFSGTCGRPTAAYQHAAWHLLGCFLLSLTRQWLMTAPLNSVLANSHRLQNPLCLPQKFNLKACAPEIQTRNLPVDPGIEPWLLQQTVPVGAHCVSAN